VGYASTRKVKIPEKTRIVLEVTRESEFNTIPKYHTRRGSIRFDSAWIAGPDRQESRERQGKKEKGLR
jgi:nucleotidyltransferase/DNA polymerase involved in DNA repair